MFSEAGTPAPGHSVCGVYILWDVLFLSELCQWIDSMCTSRCYTISLKLELQFIAKFLQFAPTRSSAEDLLICFRQLKDLLLNFGWN